MRETDCGAQIRFFCHVKAPKSQETPTKHLKYLNKIFQPRFKLPNNINIEVRGVTFQKFSVPLRKIVLTTFISSKNFGYGQITVIKGFEKALVKILQSLAQERSYKIIACMRTVL